MAVALRVYQRSSPTTLIAELDQPYDISWLDELTEVGAGEFTIPHDSPVVAANPSILDRGNIVRVNIDGTDRFAWVIGGFGGSKNRERGDGWDPVTVSGPGLLDVCRYAAVYQEYWPAEIGVDRRLFGFMSADYIEDAAWTTPQSHGRQDSHPFAGDDRPEGWADGAAEFITDDTALENNEGHFWLRAEMVVSESTQILVQATADESFDLYVAGIPLLHSDPEQRFQWNRTYSKVIELPAGTYQVAAKVWHPDRPDPNFNARWFIFSAMKATTGGQPEAQKEVQSISLTAGMDEVQEVYNDATGGTFTLTFDGQTTTSIAYDATAAVVESALEALSNVTDVFVSGSGNVADPWTVQFLDPGKTNLVTMTADDTNLTGHTTGTTIRSYDGGNGGQFTLSFAGDTTGLIAWNASSATVQTELNNLSTITDAGGVTVSGAGTSDDPWVVTFDDYGNQPDISVGTTALHGHELQRVHNNSTSGTFTLTFDGQTTGSIAYNATAATVETELEALSNIADVEVTGSGTAADPWAVEFVDPDENVAQMTSDDSGMDGTSTIKTIRGGYTPSASVTASTDGTLPNVLLRSNTTDWTVRPIGSSEPGMTPGHILRVLREEAQARGWATWVTDDFDDTNDSDGTPWTEVEFVAQVGNDSLLSVAHRMGDLQTDEVDIAMSPAGVLSAYDRRGTSLAGSVTLADTDCKSIVSRWEDELVNTVLLRTEHRWYEAPDPAPSSDRWEGFLSFGLLPNETVGRDIAEAVLNRYENPRELATYTWHEDAGPDPYVDFDNGDHITAPGWSAATDGSISGRATRILWVAGQVDTVGDVVWSAEGEQ